MLAILTIHLHLPACASLKEKRGRLKPLISRLHREFNVSVAEMDLQDKWQEAVIACAMVNSDAVILATVPAKCGKMGGRKLDRWRRLGYKNRNRLKWKVGTFRTANSNRIRRKNGSKA